MGLSRDQVIDNLAYLDVIDFRPTMSALRDNYQTLLNDAGNVDPLALRYAGSQMNIGTFEVRASLRPKAFRLQTDLKVSLSAEMKNYPSQPRLTIRGVVGFGQGWTPHRSTSAMNATLWFTRTINGDTYKTEIRTGSWRLAHSPEREAGLVEALMVPIEGIANLIAPTYWMNESSKRDKMTRLDSLQRQAEDKRRLWISARNAYLTALADN